MTTNSTASSALTRPSSKTDEAAYAEARRKLDEELFIDLHPTAALLLGGLSRSSAYRAAKEGDIPTVRIGRLIKVQCAQVKRMAGLDTPPKEAA